MDLKETIAEQKMKSVNIGDIIRLEYVKSDSTYYSTCLVVDMNIDSLSIGVLELLNDSGSFISDNFIQFNGVGIVSNFSICDILLPSIMREDEISQFTSKELREEIKKNVPQLFV